MGRQAFMYNLMLIMIAPSNLTVVGDFCRVCAQIVCGFSRPRGSQRASCTLFGWAFLLKSQQRFFKMACNSFGGLALLHLSDLLFWSVFIATTGFRRSVRLVVV